MGEWEDTKPVAKRKRYRFSYNDITSSLIVEIYPPQGNPRRIDLKNTPMELRWPSKNSNYCFLTKSEASKSQLIWRFDDGTIAFH